MSQQKLPPEIRELLDERQCCGERLPEAERDELFEELSEILREMDDTTDVEATIEMLRILMDLN